MVGFRYLARSLACRVAAESDLSGTLSASLAEELCRNLPNALADVAVPSSDAARQKTALVVDLIQLLSWVTRYASPARQEYVVHTVWGITASDATVIPVSELLAFLEVLTHQASALSVSTLLELCQIMIRLRTGTSGAVTRGEPTALTWSVVMKRLVDALFEWLPEEGEPLAGDSEKALFEVLPADATSRYRGMNHLRQRRRHETTEWQRFRTAGDKPLLLARMNRDELMLVVCTVASRATVDMRPAVHANTSAKVESRSTWKQPEVSLTAVRLEEKAAMRLTCCLRQMTLLKHFDRLFATRALESTEWNFLLALLASSVPSWRAIASTALLSADDPFGTIGARLCKELDPVVAGHEIRSIAQALTHRDAQSRALDVLVALLAVRIDRANGTGVVVSPLVDTFTTGQTLALLNMLRRTQPQWSSPTTALAANDAVAVSRHAENLFAALFAHLKRIADGEGTIALEDSTRLQYLLVLCERRLKRLADDPQKHVDAVLNDWVAEVFQLARTVLESVLSTTSSTSDAAQTATVSETASYVLAPLKTFLDLVPAYLASPALAQGQVDPTLRTSLVQQVAEMRVRLLAAWTRLAEMRALDERGLSTAETLAFAISAVSRDSAACGDSGAESVQVSALRDAQRAFALEAVVLAISAPLPEYQAAVKAYAESSTFSMLVNFRRAAQLCVDQQISLEAIERHATVRRVIFDVPRFLRALLTRSEQESRRGSASASIAPMTGAADTRSASMESQLPLQLLLCVQNLLKLGALQSEATLHMVATLLRAWTADDAVVRLMGPDVRNSVLFELCGLYSAVYPHFHVSKASRIVALECMRMAARLSLNRLAPSPTSLPLAGRETTVTIPSIRPELQALDSLWRFHCVLLSHPLGHRKTGKYIGIMQNYMVKTVLVLRARSPMTRAGSTPLPESAWPALEALLSRSSSQPPSVSMVFLPRAEDAAVVIEWNQFVFRLCRVTTSTLIACQAVDEAQRQRRLVVIAESVAGLARVILAVRSVLAPSVWNNVRRMLTIYFSVDASVHGVARRDEGLSRTFAVSVRCVWRYAALNENKGTWAARGSTVSHQRDPEVTTEAEAPVEELLTRRDLVKLFESQEALAAAPDLVAQITSRLCDVLNDSRNLGEHTGAGADQLRAVHLDDLAILRTFRAMRASSY